MQARGLAAAALASLIGAGFSAQALAPEKRRPDVAAPVPTGYEADDHFPGAAYYTAVDDDAAAGTGTTGTIQLPDMPVPAGAAAEAALDTSIQPAQPFRLAGTATDRSRAQLCLTDAVYYEAAREPDDGQRAVAQVVLNRVRHSAFPATVCGVVFQGSEKRGCQFSFACDGAMLRGAPARDAWARAGRVAAAALAGSVFAPVGMATHYHTYAVTPSWNRSLVMTGVFGAHFFHRWKGWWGTAAAFRQNYAGGEPLPAPHPSIAPVLPTPLPSAIPTPLPVAALPTTAPSPSVTPTPREAIQPAYVESGSAVMAAPQGDSQILDRWKESGKPLR
jgi:spore germination cell wall hydrolase CwlJ-like protein